MKPKHSILTASAGHRLSVLLVAAALSAVSCAVVSSPASAKPEFLEVLQKAFPSDTKIAEKSCANCHVSDSDYKLADFGKKVAAALKAAGAKNVTVAMLQKVKSGEAGGPAAGDKKAPDAAAAAPETPEPKSIIPKNVYHPAVVHFPIALFIIAVLFDIVGFKKKDSALMWAGWFNLIGGAVTALGGATSGFLAAFRMGVPLKGLILNHLVLALISTVIMWIMIGIRAKKHENMTPGQRNLYFALAVIGVLIIGYSGHLGGQFVYGE